ncbi:PREDICTED: oleoyl-acyl carrier protein thioesterase 2, chloroplastic-like isoform X2 [Nelumbo nucifera]|uniref:Acyl-[acyl-carrier-protein] hydrolase n=1 Tax=Nelumbo nucifera TaxID=4432 RepID=A0A1U7Z4C7_NELNU|nr:PREDICTED: oleoyl-acyl carrier protein thioesterase 2, chloroplastic-like isoform X2 [Nelumbo nucifera]
MLKACIAADQLQLLSQCRFVSPPKAFNPTRRGLASVSCCSSSSSSVSRPLSSSRAPDLSVSESIAGTSAAANGSAVVSFADRLRLGSLTEDGLSYKEKFIVRSYEVGINKTATVETIANLLQEVGCNHAQSVGFSTDGFATTLTMRKLHLIWVTARMHIEVYKYPAWGDVVEIETWCQGEGRIGTRRDWILRDFATGAVIGRATRLAFPEEDNSSLKKIPKLEDPPQYCRQGLVPRRADLDMNQHVNNVTYIGWVLESIPQEIIDTHELQKITLDYRQECQHDDVVDSLASIELGGGVEAVSELHGANGSATVTQGTQDCCQFLHFLRLSSNGLEINRGRTEWRRKPAR